MSDNQTNTNNDEGHQQAMTLEQLVMNMAHAITLLTQGQQIMQHQQQQQQGVDTAPKLSGKPGSPDMKAPTYSGKLPKDSTTGQS